MNITPPFDAIRVIEGSHLPPNTIVASSDLYLELKDPTGAAERRVKELEKLNKLAADLQRRLRARYEPV